MTDEKEDKVEVVFAPGCFDNFEGTQEELDELVAEIQRMIDSGELFEKSKPVDLDNMAEEEAILLARALGIEIEGLEEEPKRLLN